MNVLFPVALSAIFVCFGLESFYRQLLIYIGKYILMKELVKAQKLYCAYVLKILLSRRIFLNVTCSGNQAFNVLTEINFCFIKSYRNSQGNFLMFNMA